MGGKDWGTGTDPGGMVGPKLDLGGEGAEMTAEDSSPGRSPDKQWGGSNMERNKRWGPLRTSSILGGVHTRSQEGQMRKRGNASLRIGAQQHRERTEAQSRCQIPNDRPQWALGSSYLLLPPPSA